MKYRILACVGLLALASTAHAASDRAAIIDTCGPAFLKSLPKASQVYRIGGTVSGTTFSFELGQQVVYSQLPAPSDDFDDFGFGIAAQQNNLVAVVNQGVVTVYGPQPQLYANGMEPDDIDAANRCTAYTQGPL